MTRSRLEGITFEEEARLRKQGTEMMSHCAKDLNMEARVMICAQTFFHRYYMFNNIVLQPTPPPPAGAPVKAGEPEYTQHHMIVAVACLFLAAKVEEYPKFLEDVVRYTYYYRHGKAATARLMADKEALEVEKDRVLTCERNVVSNMGFDLHVTSPHAKLSAMFSAVLAVAKAEGRTDLAEARTGLLSMSNNFLNDSMHHLICLQHQPARMAAIALAMTEKIMVDKKKIKPFPKIKVGDSEVMWWSAPSIVPLESGDAIAGDKMKRYLKDFHTQVYKQGGGVTSVATASQANRKRPAPAAPVPVRATPAQHVSPTRSSEDSLVDSGAQQFKKARVEGTAPPVTA